jgi:hypothetical protein
VLFFVVAGMIVAPEHQECILATVIDDITRKAPQFRTPGTGPTPRVIKRGRHNSYRVRQPGGHGARHSGPAMIKLVSLPLPAA